MVGVLSIAGLVATILLNKKRIDDLEEFLDAELDEDEEIYEYNTK